MEFDGDQQESTAVSTVATTTPSAATAVNVEQSDHRPVNKQKFYKNQFTALLNRCQIIQQVKFNMILSAAAYCHGTSKLL